MGVTALHIALLSAVALVYFELVYLSFLPNGLANYRAFNVQVFILGVQDIFVSYMLWFIMDDSN